MCFVNYMLIIITTTLVLHDEMMATTRRSCLSTAETTSLGMPKESLDRGTCII